MRQMSIQRFKDFTKNWFFWLLIVTGIAIFVRSLPAWTNAAWGVDFGIYYGLTQSYIQTGDIINNRDVFLISF